MEFDRAIKIRRSVSVKYKTTVWQILSLSRKKKTVLARREIVCRVRNELGLTMEEIGLLINRTHSTVIYHLKKGVKL